MNWVKEISAAKSQLLHRLARILQYLDSVEPGVAADIYELNGRGRVSINTHDIDLDVDFTIDVSDLVVAINNFDKIVDMEIGIRAGHIRCELRVEDDKLYLFGQGYIPDSILGSYIEHES